MSTSRLLWLLLGLGACTPEDTPKGGNPGGGTETDADADGHVAADDCDDTNPTIHPGAVEVCDGIDQDCDGVADEDASDAPTWYLDGDSDGAGDPAVSVTACAAPADHVDTGDDCDDADSAVAPGAVEQPGDEVDQDCDGAELCFVDADDDGDRPVDTPTVVSDDLDCTDAGEATATEPAADCDDTDPTVASILAEVPGDGTDQDCDGLELCFVDADEDGFATEAESTAPSADLACAEPGLLSATAPRTDCDDTNATIHPDAAEGAGDEVDQDCDGGEVCFVDADGDGERPDALATVVSTDPDCADAGEATAAAPTADCDDTDPAISSSAVEQAGDAVDQDCDGTELCWADLDEDGHGDAAGATVASTDTDCADPGEAATTDPLDDCDDTDPASHPLATEVVGDGVDQDCDGTEVCYVDADGDAHAEAGGSTVVSSDIDCAGAGEATDTTPVDDCDDTDVTIHPEATELAGDAVDQDCDGSELCYVDADDDGYRPDSTATVASADIDCTGTGEAEDTDPTGDCDDSFALVSPAASEVCNDLDDDCNGSVDDNATDADTWFPDADSDAYGDGSSSTLACDQPSGMVSRSGDCDDTDDAIHPGAIELCWDTIDDDCDSLTATDPDCAPEGTAWINDITFSGLDTSALGRVSLAGVEDLSADIDAVRELVVGSPDVGMGSIYVYDVVDEGGYPTFSTSDALVQVQGLSSSSEFGATLVALPDFDGDGSGELAVAAPGSAGAVYVFSLDGSLQAASTASDADWSFTGDGSSFHAGDSMVHLGDVNGDGLDDLGLSGEGWDGGDGDAGSAWVVFGDSPSGTLSAGDHGVLAGEHEDDAAGAVGAPGDVNGDGYDDIVVGAAGSDDTASGAGKAYLYLGPLSARRYELGAAQLKVVGESASDAVGSAVFGTGDLDADGTPDFAVLSQGWDDTSTSDVGALGVFAGPYAAGTMSFEDADYMLVGAATDELDDLSVSAGDVDGDGWSDLLVGAPDSDTHATGGGAGALFYGPLSATTFHLTDADADFAGAASQKMGSAVLVSDFAADGYADVFVASLDSSVYGTLDIVFGGTREEVRAVDADRSTDDDGDGYSEDDGDCDDTRATRSPGLTEVCDSSLDEDCDGQLDPCAPAASIGISAVRRWVHAAYNGASLGDPVSVVGDINGDGVADIVAGDPQFGSGAARVWFGPMPPQGLDDTQADAAITAISTSNDVGGFTGAAGDLDGDGFDDLVVGASGSSGTQMVVYRGGPDFEGGSVSTADWQFSSRGSGGYIASAVGVGDVNDDGHDDFAVGTPNATDGEAQLTGAVGIHFGPIPTGTRYPLDDADVVIYGESYNDDLGSSLKRAGDVNGDGIDDIIVKSSVFEVLPTSSTDFDTHFAIYFGPLGSSATLAIEDADLFLVAATSLYEDAWEVADVTGDGFGDLISYYSLGTADTSFGVASLVGAQGYAEFEELLVATVDDDSSGLYYLDTGVATGDFNRDGYTDLSLGGCSSLYSGNSAGAAWIWLGPLSGHADAADADHTVTGTLSYCVGSSIDLGDIDGDGFDDWVLGSPDWSRYPHTAPYRSGGLAVVPGGWTADTLTRTAADPTLHDPTADLDADGWSTEDGDCNDLRADAYPGATEDCADPIDLDCDGYRPACAPVGVVDYLPPQARGVGYDRTTSSSFALLDDLDGDGRTDFVITAAGERETIVVFGRTHWGALEVDKHSDPVIGRSPTNYDYPHHATGVDDVDGDGVMDLLIWSRLGGLHLFPSNGGYVDSTMDDTRFTITHADSSSDFPGTFFDAGDLDGDSVHSLAATAWLADENGTNSGAVYLFRGTLSAGSYTEADAELTITGRDAGAALGDVAVSPGDIDGDGLSDLLLTDWYSAGSDTESFYIWLGDASTGVVSAEDAAYRVQTGTAYAGLAAVPLPVGDIDGDGYDDLAASRTTGTTSLGGTGTVFIWDGLPATADSELSDADLLLLSSTYGEGVGDSAAPGLDFDQDGVDDLIVSTSSQTLFFYGPVSLAGVLDTADADGVWDDVMGDLDTTGDATGDGLPDLWAGRVLVPGGPR